MSGGSLEQKDEDIELKSIEKKDQALRRWAVRLLNDKSPEKFSTEEQEALLLPSPAVAARFESLADGGNSRKPENPVALNQTIVANASKSESPAPIPLNIVMPNSLSFSSTLLRVSVIEVPPIEFVELRKSNGGQVAKGEIMTLSDLQNIFAIDRTKGGGGTAVFLYEVIDPLGRKDSATVNIVLNPDR
ncbi:MAG: hypothetical protein JNN30_06205 [Rhodanobacteraceae bacterium]|nr:hypothetical protein [Rhodanobacteraceae bacterium]